VFCVVTVIEVVIKDAEETSGRKSMQLNYAVHYCMMTSELTQLTTRSHLRGEQLK